MDNPAEKSDLNKAARQMLIEMEAADLWSEESKLETQKGADGVKRQVIVMAATALGLGGQRPPTD